MRTHWNDVNLPIDSPIGTEAGQALVWDGTKWTAQKIGLWHLAYTFKDLNPNTAINIDTGILDHQWDMWKLIFLVANQNTSSGLRVDLRVNGDSSSNYHLKRYDGDSRVESEWRLGTTSAGSVAHGVYYLWAHFDPELDPRSDVYPGIAGVWGRDADSPMVGGHLEVPYTRIDRIQIMSNNNATMKVAIYGMKFPA